MNLATEGKTIRSREDGLQEKIARFRKQEEEVRSLDLAFRDYVAALDTVSKAESRLMAAWAGNIQDTGDSPSYALTTLITKSQKQAKNTILVKIRPPFLGNVTTFFLQHFILCRACIDASDPGLGEP